MEIRILGNVEIIADDGHTISLSRSAERCVLGAFALSPGRRLGVDDLVSRVWGDDPPERADETLATYVRSVRRALTQAGMPPGALQSHRPRMYSLNVDPPIIDYQAYRLLCADARNAAARDDPAEAAGCYSEALARWGGPALSGVGTQWADQTRHGLDQERTETVYAMCEQLSETGDQSTIAAWIERLAQETIPTDRMMLTGMRALAKAGRRALIPSFTDRLTRRMIESAGVRPSAAVLESARRAAAGDDLQSRDVATLRNRSVAKPTRSNSSAARPPAQRCISLAVTNSRQVHQSAGRIVILKRSGGHSRER